MTGFRSVEFSTQIGDLE